MAIVQAGNVGTGPSTALWSTWDSAHDTSAGPSGVFAGTFNNMNSSTSGTSYYGVGVNYIIAGGIFTQYQIRRGFLDFDLSGLSGTATSATLKVKARQIADTLSTDDLSIIPIKSTKSAGMYLPSNFNDFTGWEVGWDGDAGDTSVVPYATQQSFPHASDTDEWVSWTLNADALTDLNSAVGSGNYGICLMEYDHDFKDVAPSLNDYHTMNFTMTGDDEPYLDITFSKPPRRSLSIKPGGKVILKPGGKLILR